MDTFLGEGSQDQDMGTEGGEGRHPSCTETQPRSPLDASFPNPLAPSQLPAQMPVLLVPSTCLGEELNEDVGNGGTLLPPASLPRRTAHSPTLKSQPESGGQEAGGQQGDNCAYTFPPQSAHGALHMRLQLLALALCISPSFPAPFPFPRSGRPAS